MHFQIVMDRHGDSRHAFGIASAGSFADAEARFKVSPEMGFSRGCTQPGRLVLEFDPTSSKAGRPWAFERPSTPSLPRARTGACR